jgi:hypothetical protein
MRRISVPAILVLAVCHVSARHGQTQTQPQNNSSRQQYSIAEYNAYETAARERDAAKQILLLDEFVSNHPQSALLIYVYPLYYAAYGQLKNFPKVVIYADNSLRWVTVSMLRHGMEPCGRRLMHTTK